MPQYLVPDDDLPVGSTAKLYDLRGKLVQTAADADGTGLAGSWTAPGDRYAPEGVYGITFTDPDSGQLRSRRSVSVGPTSSPSTTTGPLAIATQPGSYTLTADDADTLVRIDAAAASVVTVPPDADVGIAVGRSVLVAQRGAGQVTLAPGAGVTLNSRGDAMKTAGRHAQVSLTKTAPDEWLVSGDLVV